MKVVARDPDPKNAARDSNCAGSNASFLPLVSFVQTGFPMCFLKTRYQRYVARQEGIRTVLSTILRNKTPKKEQSFILKARV